MSFAHFSSMEEIPLEDEDRTSEEYRVLLAYAQRRLSASKYKQLLQRDTKNRESSSPTRIETQGPGVTPAGQGQALQEKPSQALRPLAKQESQKMKKKKKKRRSSNWKRRLLPPCLQGQTEDLEEAPVGEKNGKLNIEPESRIKPSFSTEAQDDTDISRVADKLAKLVDRARSRSKTIEGRGLARTVSLEEDGGGGPRYQGKTVPHEDDEKDNEEKMIDTIVALLRKSGDELEAKMRKDKAFYLSFMHLMSYSFFRRIANQFLEEVSVDSTRESEAHVQSTKAAYVMEVTTRLTAVDNHPMNLVLGFGTKYLKENFRPWVCSQGGWEKTLGLLDQEEVE